MTNDAVRHRNEHELERLIFFSDAVFAIAITLLIIDVHPPALAETASRHEWLVALLNLMPHIAAFTLSFLVIGALWVSHHTTLALLARYDARLLWPNLLLLMSVVFLPFTSQLISVGSQNVVPFAVYSASLLVCALLKVRLTWIALNPALVAADVSVARLKAERRRMWIMPIAAAVTLALAFVVPAWNCMAMILISVLRRMPYFRLPAGGSQ